MHRGYVKLHRALTDWEWYKKPNVGHFFTHCLLRANHKQKNYKGVEVLAGQFISGRKTLSSETGLTEQQVRTCLKYLKSTGELTTTPTKGIDGKYTVFTLINWKIYQTDEEPTNTSTSGTTKGQPKVNQGLTTNKNDKNDKNVKKYIGVQDFSEFQNLNVEAWGRWLEYKKMIKSKYKTINGEVAKINELISISGGSTEIQEKIINQSINNEWKGLFPLKKEEQKQWSLF